MDYCFCHNNNNSSGLLVGCDNVGCGIEWFHGECVGIKNASEIAGKLWYCPTCAKDMKNGEKHANRRSRPVGTVAAGVHTRLSNVATTKSISVSAAGRPILKSCRKLAM